jgi:hypothetical protein
MVHGLDNVLKKDYIPGTADENHIFTTSRNSCSPYLMNTSRRTHGKTSSGNTLVTHTHRRYSLT